MRTFSPSVRGGRNRAAQDVFVELHEPGEVLSLGWLETYFVTSFPFDWRVARIDLSMFLLRLVLHHLQSLNHRKFDVSYYIQMKCFIVSIVYF